MDLYQQLQPLLISMAEESYQKFSSRLLPGVDAILGVRIPLLRNLAKQLAAGDWKAYLETAGDDSFEEIMLQGMTIGYIKTEPKERLKRIAQFVPKIDNWSVCDSFCSGLKFTKQHPEMVWEFLQSYFDSQKEFEVRFAVVMLLDYYADAANLERSLDRLFGVFHPGYYAKMAVGWALSCLYFTDAEPVFALLAENKLDDVTRQMAIRKILESNRVSQTEKDEIRKLKRKSL